MPRPAHRPLEFEGRTRIVIQLSAADAINNPLKSEPRLKAHLPRNVGLVSNLPEASLVARIRLLTKILWRPEDVRIAKLHRISKVISFGSQHQIPLLAKFKVLGKREIQVVRSIGANSRQDGAGRSRSKQICRLRHACVIEPFIDVLRGTRSAVVGD